MSKCFNKECDYCKDNECRFGIEDNAGCHWYIGEPLKEPLSKKFQDYAEEELPKLREQIKQQDQRIEELEKELEVANKQFREAMDFKESYERKLIEQQNIKQQYIKENAELKKLIETCQDEYDLQQFLKEENGVLARKNAEFIQENIELKQKLEELKNGKA